MITKFEKFNESAGDYEDKAIGVKIKNEYTKLVNSPDGGAIELSAPGKEPSKTDITNIERTYPEAEVKVVKGKTVLQIKGTK